MRKRLVFTMTAALLAVSSLAQETEMDAVTVTATLNPARVSQTGRNLLVVKGERFAQLPVHSLDELLRYIPGIEVQARGPFGAQSDITMRGGTFQQVLVLVDGVRVNDPNTGHFTAYIPIAPSEIDRIEVLKGASSTLYGSDAVGGVIHVITKSFSAKRDVSRQSVIGQLKVGEYGTTVLDAGIFQSNGRTSFGAGGQAIHTNGQLQRGTRGFVESKNITASVNHFFGDSWQLSFRTAIDKRKFAAQNFYTGFLSDTAQETVTSFWNQLQVARRGTNNVLRLQAGYKNLQDSFSFNPRSATNQNRSHLWQALITNERNISAKTSITPGFQFVTKKIASNDRGNHSVSQLAAFVLLNHQLGEHFYLAPAARVEWNERAGWELVPQVALSYRSGHLQLRTSAGKTIRDADFTERFNNYNKTIVSAGQRLGNPELQAEQSWSYEAGADYFLGSSLKVSATAFQRRHTALIDYVVTPYAQIRRKENLLPTASYAFARNIAEVNTSGAETDIQYSKQWKKGGAVWATLGLVWLDSKSSDTVPSFYLSSHARFLTNFAIRYTYKRFSVGITGLYKQRQSQSGASPLLAKVSRDYFLVNLKAEANVVGNVSAFLEIDNVTNRQYTDLLGAAMPGRWLLGGIKISLTK